LSVDLKTIQNSQIICSSLHIYCTRQNPHTCIGLIISYLQKQKRGLKIPVSAVQFRPWPPH